MYKVKYIDKEWYSVAMDFFRKRMNNTVFVVLSDEPQWSKHSIIGPDVYQANSEVHAALNDVGISQLTHHKFCKFHSLLTLPFGAPIQS